MAKIFIINDTNITGGVASTHDIGTSSLTWRHAYFSGTITVGTVSATGGVIGNGTLTIGTVSATGNIIGSASLTIGTGTIIAAKITATTGSFTALLTAGTASISGAIIGGTTITGGTGSFSGNFFTTGTASIGGAIIGGTTLTIGTVSATGNAIVAGTASIGGAIIGATTITVGTVSATGQLISAHTAGIVGQLAALTYTFGVLSDLQVTSIPTPFAGSIDQVYVTTGSVSAVVAQYTVRVGSSGSVAVATVSNTTASQGVQEALTTTVTTFAITNALVATRSVQGTAGDTSICIVVRKTA